MISKSMKVTAILVGGLALGGVGITEAVRSTALAQQELPVVPTPETEKIFIIDPTLAPDQAIRAVPDGETAESLETATHLRDILVALHQYNALNNHFPRLAIWAPDGLPALSWRVTILPFVGQIDLFNRFHLDEPWDSPHNIELVEQMPKIFETPDHPAPKAGETRIRGFSGPGTAFDGEVTMAKIEDGTSNTAILGIAAQSVPWTKPEGLMVAKDRPLPWLVDSEEGPGPILGMTDGSLRRLKPEISRKLAVLTALTSIAGGEAIGQDVFVPSPGLSSRPDLSALYRNHAGGDEVTPERGGAARLGAGMLPAPTPSGGAMSAVMTGSEGPSLSIEQRLEAIERKLDLLIQQSGTPRIAPGLEPSPTNDVLPPSFPPSPTP
jgi:hypothetical protein